MFSKLLRPSYRHNPVMLLTIKRPQKIHARKFMGLIPPSQYDTSFPRTFQLGTVMRENWETIPLVVTTVIALSFMFLSILWACKNKVDVVFTARNRCNISRTMDLRNPSIHKLRIINQRYEPWPEMQDVLDKMAAAEKRALVRMQSCSHP